jgi:rhodanese-related sulfurtransferase
MRRDLPPRDADAFISEGALAVDVREPAELEEDGRIDGALHIPLGSLSERAGELPRDRPLLMVCRSGVRSAMAADALQASGFEAHNLDGGILAWERDGLPVERNP